MNVSIVLTMNIYCLYTAFNIIVNHKLSLLFAYLLELIRRQRPKAFLSIHNLLLTEKNSL